MDDPRHQQSGAARAAVPASGDPHRARAPWDVVVVGAGVIGLASGWRAAQRGLRVLVLDAAEPGSGASGVAAGMLAPVTEADFGEEQLLELNLASARRYARFAAELEAAGGEPTGYLQSGALHVALDRDQAAELERLHELQRDLGLDARRLDSRACRALEPGLSPRVVAGVEAPGDHQVSPRGLTRALRAALGRAGGSLRPATRAVAVLSQAGDASGVVLETGETIEARAVVVAAGARSAELRVPGHAVPVRPVKGQILRLRGPGSARIAQRIVRTPEVYAVPRADGRLVVGATVEERGFDGAVTAGAVMELLRCAYEALPGIAELALVETAAGHRPGTPDNLPVVGEGELGGLVWATGHWRNGVLLAPITAEAVVAHLCGEPPPAELESFTPARFRDPALTAEPRP